MSTQESEAKKPNHVRNSTVIFAIGILAFLGWNAFGAAQCMSRGGDIQFSGVGIGCLLDYSNR